MRWVPENHQSKQRPALKITMVTMSLEKAYRKAAKGTVEENRLVMGGTMNYEGSNTHSGRIGRPNC